MTNYIFVTGGIVSSLGKGVTVASLALLLQEHGYKVSIKKIEPYLNSDPSSMSPIQYGEVFITEDGAETDLDLGHYERFTNQTLKKGDSTTCGKLFSQVLIKERNGHYQEKAIQVVPHITNEIKEFFTSQTSDSDFVLCEIGGAVGDFDTIPVLEALRQFTKETENKPLFIHLTLLPNLSLSDEIKTRPTQYSIKEFFRYGLSPDILLCRSTVEITAEEKKDMSYYCNIKEEDIITSLNLPSIYFMPILFNKNGLDNRILNFFKLESKKEPNLTKWEKFKQDFEEQDVKLSIAVLGKYANYHDSYKSIKEALIHAGTANHAAIDIKWINHSDLIDSNCNELLSDVSGIILAGGYHESGNVNLQNISKYARQKKIPLFTIGNGTIILLEDLLTNEAKVSINNDLRLASKVRIGAFDIQLYPNSNIYEVYNNKDEISERYRTKTTINPKYKNDLKQVGLNTTGNCSDMLDSVVFELDNHPWCMGVMFHPEFKSRPFAPHPLFMSFIKANISQLRLL